jgi:predicted nucleotidyltransferase
VHNPPDTDGEDVPVSQAPRSEDHDRIEERFLEVLDDATEAVGQAGLPFVIIGGIASAALGRPRWNPEGADVDLFVRTQDADATQGSLAEAGFEAVEGEPHWVLKVEKNGVTVDIIFRAAGDLYLDDEMLSRAEFHEFRGRKVPLVSREDLLVMKALAFGEQTPSYWHEALGIIARGELDWDYVLLRARHGARRILSLLLYAQSNDLPVPARAVRELFELADGNVEGDRWNEEPGTPPTT